MHYETYYSCPLRFFFFLFVYPQTALNVPAQYSTIQGALNAAHSGDTVLVQPGTYYENITWPNVNGIKLISAGDTSNTIIDARKLSNVITIISNNLIDSNTVIRGFKLINGDNVSYGGGVLCNKANPKLENLLIESNKANINGGGLYIFYCSPTINYCIIKSNTVISTGGVYYGGGGVYTNNSQAVLSNTTISDNYGFFGGGLLLFFSQITIKNCTINRNITPYLGGGIYAINSSPFINYSIIFNNKGTGISCYARSNPILEKTYIVNNSGLGIDCTSESYPQLLKVTVAFNGLGGIMAGEPFTISHLTIANNCSSSKTYSGIYGLVTISESNIAFNNYGLKNLANTSIAQATNNWWGDSTGPYHPTQNPSGNGDSVNTFVNVTPWLTQPDTTAPPIPIQNVKIKNTNSSSISLNWDASPLGDLKGYKVYWDTDSLGYTYKNSVDAGRDTSYTITGLTAGYNYHIAVTCYDNSGEESWFSQDISAKTTPPVLQLLTSQIIFQNTAVGDSVIIPVKIVSANSSPLIISSLNNSLTVFKPSLTAPITINGLDTLKLNIAFKPIAFGSFTDTLSITSNGGNAKVILQGQSPIPTLAVSSGNINFGTVVRNTSYGKTIKVVNSSVNKLSVDSIYTLSPQFSVNPASILASIGDSVAITVTFSPNTFGLFKDTLCLHNNSANSLVKIPLSGNSPFQIVFNGAELNFGNIAVGQASTQSVSLSNIFNGVTTIDSIYTFTSQFSVSPHKAILNSLDTLHLTIQFTPNVFATFIDSVVMLNKELGSAIIIKLTGVSPFPYPIVGNSEMAFDSVYINTSSAKYTSLRDSSLNSLNLDSVYTLSKIFTANFTRGTKILGSGESISLKVEFKPVQTGEFSDTVFIINNSETNPIKIFVSGIGKDVNPVPVELASFSGKYSSGVIVLNWSTATETNNKGFEIEKRIMNDNWEKIGFVPGQGTTTQENQYSFSDNSSIFSGKYYYRLKQLDYNGSFKYSNQIEVNVNNVPSIYSLYQNYPNPFNPSTTIKYDLPKASYVKICVYNLLGEIISTLVDGSQNAGYYNATWNAVNTASGIYFYSIYCKPLSGSKEFRDVKKMILIK